MNLDTEIFRPLILPFSEQLTTKMHNKNAKVLSPKLFSEVHQCSKMQFYNLILKNEFFCLLYVCSLQ